MRRRIWVIILLLTLLLLPSCAERDQPQESTPSEQKSLPALLPMDPSAEIYGARAYRFEHFEIVPLRAPDGWPAIYEKNGLFGYQNRDGTLVTEAIYDYCRPFFNGIASARQTDADGNHNWTTYSSHGARLDYDGVHGFHQGLSLVRSGDLYGYVNLDGEVVVPIVYRQIAEEYFEERVACARREGGWVQLDLAEGLELRYEPYRPEDAALYDHTVTLPADKIYLVRGQLLTADDLPPEEHLSTALLLAGRQFDIYEGGQLVGTGEAALQVDVFGLFVYLLEGYIEESDDLEHPAEPYGENSYFAVLSGTGNPIPGLVQADVEHYRITLECFLLEHGFSGREIAITSGYEGRFFPGGTTSAVLELHEQLADDFWLHLAAPPVNNGANALLLVPDVERPEEYVVLSGLTSGTNEYLVGLYDLEGDGTAELLVDRRFYEGWEPAVIRLQDWIK